MESILTSIKKLLGITEEYEHFDSDIIIHINSVFMILSQIGIGPDQGFVLKDKFQTWNEFIGADDPSLEAVKTYTYLKVRLLFDPPASSIVTEAINRMVSEYEWRLNILAETPKNKEEE